KALRAERQLSVYRTLAGPKVVIAVLDQAYIVREAGPHRDARAAEDHYTIIFERLNQLVRNDGTSLDEFWHINLLRR
ncbi:hypothetical protein, partial [Stenotrophomonas sepilia]|uniref:hypothetical protein n=1 Tax=Stenotrophomonas sepilia TaxID=2860290 RepID=UPI00289F47B1